MKRRARSESLENQYAATNRVGRGRTFNPRATEIGRRFANAAVFNSAYWEERRSGGGTVINAVRGNRKDNLS